MRVCGVTSMYLIVQERPEHSRREAGVVFLWNGRISLGEIDRHAIEGGHLFSELGLTLLGDLRLVGAGEGKGEGLKGEGLKS